MRDTEKDSRAVKQIKAALAFHKVDWHYISWEPFEYGSKRGQWIVHRQDAPDIVGATTKKLCSESIPKVLC